MKRSVYTYLLWYIIVIFFVITLFFNVSSHGEQQAGYLSKAFLQGKLFFLEKPGTWDDVLRFEGHYFWHEGPFPAVLLMPFIFIADKLGFFFYQGYLQFFLTIGSFYFAYKLARKHQFSENDSLLLAFAFCFASVYQMIAFVSWVWYLSQAVTVFLLLFSLHEFFTRKRFWLIGILFGCLLATRPTASLGILFFLLTVLYTRQSLRKKIKQLLQLLFPMGMALALLLLYNYMRFHNFFETGYMLVSNFTLPPQKRYELLHYGLFQLRNIPTNIYYYFFKSLDPVLLPVTSYWGDTFILKAPYVTIKYPGTSFFVTSPFFIYLFTVSLKKSIAKFCLITMLVILFPLLCYYWPGWTQVGPRYVLDLLPFAYLLLLVGLKKKKLSLLMKLLIIVSALWNVYLFSRVF